MNLAGPNVSVVSSQGQKIVYNVTGTEQRGLLVQITRTDPAESIQFIKGSWDSNADPAIPPERRKAGDITHSVALINACKPWHWREQFPPSNTPSPEVARKAREKYGWLLNGKDSNALLPNAVLASLSGSVPGQVPKVHQSRKMLLHRVSVCPGEVDDFADRDPPAFPGGIDDLQ